MGGHHGGRGRAGGVFGGRDDPEVAAQAHDGQVRKEGQARHDATPLHRPRHVRLHEPTSELISNHNRIRLLNHKSIPLANREKRLKGTFMPLFFSACQTGKTNTILFNALFLFSRI